MGFLTKAKASVSSALPALISRATDAQTAVVTGINRWGLSGFNALETIPGENIELFKQGYIGNHVCFTIADWKARQLALAPPIVYDVKDEKSFAQYSALKLYQKKDSYTLRRKALEEIDDSEDDMVQRLRNPNPIQEWSEFAYAYSIYYDFGNALIYGVRLDVGYNKGQVREMYLLSTARYSGENPSVVGYESYIDSVTGYTSRIPGADVLHIRQFNGDPDLNGGQLWGMSKLTPARKLLTKSTNSTEAEAEMLQNRGARTIIFPKNYDGMDPHVMGPQAAMAAEQIRKKLRQAGSGGVAANSVELGSIELGMSVVDMDIIESNKGTWEDFCALWHVDTVAVRSSVSDASRANAETAVKNSLQKGVLPDQQLLAKKLNSWFVPAYNNRNKYKRHIDFNTDVYPELQSNKVEIASWADSVPMTGDEKRELFGWSTLGTPEMQVPLIKNTLMPATDLIAPPVDPNAVPNDGSYN